MDVIVSVRMFMTESEFAFLEVTYACSVVVPNATLGLSMFIVLTSVFVSVFNM